MGQLTWQSYNQTKSSSKWLSVRGQHWAIGKLSFFAKSFSIGCSTARDTTERNKPGDLILAQIENFCMKSCWKFPVLEHFQVTALWVIQKLKYHLPSRLVMLKFTKIWASDVWRLIVQLWLRLLAAAAMIAYYSLPHRRSTAECWFNRERSARANAWASCKWARHCNSIKQAG